MRTFDAIGPQLTLFVEVSFEAGIGAEILKRVEGQVAILLIATEPHMIQKHVNCACENGG